MITGLDHIAVAVSDLGDGIRRLAEDFGLHVADIEAVREAMTTTAFFPIKKTRIELIHPLDGQGPVQKYLDKQRRGGLHHLCFGSDNIDADVARLKQRGYQFLTDDPYPGAGGSRVIFIHPKCCDGVLVEINQPAAGKSSHG